MREERVSRESAGMRRWRGGRSDTSPVRGCVSKQINQQSGGWARSCVTEISLVVVFCLETLLWPPLIQQMQRTQIHIRVYEHECEWTRQEFNKK